MHVDLVVKLHARYNGGTAARRTAMRAQPGWLTGRATGSWKRR